MAEIHYFGVGTNGSKARINELRGDLLEMENAALKTLTISKTKLIGELDGAGTLIERFIGESGLSPREKKEVLTIWERTKKAVFNSRTDWNKLLREARRGVNGSNGSNGAHPA
jgi:hypothetical protein